jgi:ABC-2 type transport system permease protein
MSSGKQFRKMFGAHIKMMFREKQVWFWNIFFPIILMSIFMVIFGGGSDSEFKAKIAVVKPAQSQDADRLLAQLHQLPAFEWKSEQPVAGDQADTWVKDKDVDAVIRLPDNGDVKAIRLTVNKERQYNATSQAVAGILNQFVQQANMSAAGVQPVYRLDTNAVSSGSADLSYEDFLMTGMIALSLAQGVRTQRYTVGIKDLRQVPPTTAALGGGLFCFTAPQKMGGLR